MNSKIITATAFELVGGAQPLALVPVHVNGRGPFRFVLDTGAGMSLVSPQLAQQLGISALKSVTGHGAAGTVHIEVGIARSLAVGSSVRENVEVGITLELSRIASAIGTVVDGDLGYDFLRHHRVTVDYRTNTLHLSNGDSKAPNGDARKSIPFRLAHTSKPLMLVPVIVNDRSVLTFAVDTGSSVTVVSRRLVKEMALAPGPLTTATGGGGSVVASIGSINSVEIGSKRVQRLPVLVVDFLETLSAAIDVQLDGIVGYNFLRQFCVTIDYPNKQLALG